jgi:hypothetical protein
MEGYHLYFFILKFFILLLIALISLKIIPIKNKILILIDFVFKISFGTFIIIFFSINKYDNLKKYDRILIILSGFILILLIDYIEVINVLFNLHIKDDRYITNS